MDFVPIVNELYGAVGDCLCLYVHEHAVGAMSLVCQYVLDLVFPLVECVASVPLDLLELKHKVNHNN